LPTIGVAVGVRVGGTGVSLAGMPVAGGEMVTPDGGTVGVPVMGDGVTLVMGTGVASGVTLGLPNVQARLTMIIPMNVDKRM
jgi:hypothetical protein